MDGEIVITIEVKLLFLVCCLAQSQEIKSRRTSLSPISSTSTGMFTQDQNLAPIGISNSSNRCTFDTS